MRRLLLLALSAYAHSVILLKGGTVVNHDSALLADVLIDGEVILAVGLGLSDVPSSARVIDATGKLVIPGGIETHAHLSFPKGGASWGGPATCDDALSGHGAAAAGGTTTGTRTSRPASCCPLDLLTWPC